jgi:hypothetical protein
VFERSIFAWFDSCSPFLVVWVSVFIGASVVKLALTTKGRDFKLLDGLIGSELPGLPLALLHSVCFVKAIMIGDWASTLLFLWWGPGFVWVASFYLYIHAKKRPFDWSPYARPTSVACKVIYVVLIVAFFYHGFVGIPFVFSIWIMHDQIRLSWFDNNADRSRRLFEDLWFFRIGYAVFLFVPWFSSNAPLQTFSMVIGPIIAALWIGGLIRVIRAGRFHTPPASFENLRDIVYLLRRAPDD